MANGSIDISAVDNYGEGGSYPPATSVPTSARARFTNQYLTTRGGTGSEEQADLDYTCLIVCNDLGITIKASLPETFMHDVSSSYETPFAQGLLGMMPGVGSMAKTLGLQLTTQALTMQVWQGSTVGQISLPMIFQVETDANKDVLEPLMKLMFLTMPREEQEGGFLEAPGPHLDLASLLKEGFGELGALKNDVFGSEALQQGLSWGKAAAQGKGIPGQLSGFLDNFSSANRMADATKEAVASSYTGLKNSSGRVASRVGSTIVKSIKNNISVYIGRYMYFPSVIITDVQQTHLVQPLLDGNMSRVECTVQFQPFFLPTQRDIALMYPAASEDLRRQIDAQAAGPSASGGNTAGWVSQG